MKKFGIILAILGHALRVESAENSLVSLETFFAVNTTEGKPIYGPINKSLTENLELEDICRLSGVSLMFNQCINRKKLLQKNVFLICSKIKNSREAVKKLEEQLNQSSNIQKDLKDKVDRLKHKISDSNNFSKQQIYEERQSKNRIEEQKDQLEQKYRNLEESYQHSLMKLSEAEEKANKSHKLLSLLLKPNLTKNEEMYLYINLLKP